MPGSVSCLIIADDFTGACDTGLQLAQAGLRTHVVHGPPLPPQSEALVWNTGTRNAAAAEARLQMEETCAHLQALEARVWYKKIDSTLRGPFAAELDALMGAHPFDLCVLAPAFPRAGRITIGGYQLLHGVPVARTEMGRDRGAPVCASFLPRLLEGQAELEVHLLGLDRGPGGLEALVRELARRRGRRTVLVCDAASEADLARLAAAAARLEAPLPLFCGSAGLAAHLPAAFALEGRGPGGISRAPARGGALVLAGSDHPLTRRQLAAARRSGLREWTLAEGEEEELVAALKAQLLAGGDAALSTGECRESAPAPAIESLARIGRRLVRESAPAGVVVSGGWTAGLLLEALAGERVEILEAIDPGVPLCRVSAGPFAGLPLITKAGALGSEQVLVKALSRLRPSAAGTRPLLGLTMGDPCGIGPEIIARALAEEEVYRLCRPLVIGHPVFLERNLRFAGRELSLHRVEHPAEGSYRPGRIDVLCPLDLDLEKIEAGRVCPEGGRAAARWVESAVDLALAERIDGIVTAPLNKEALNQAGFHYAGHTELLGERTRTRDYCMMLASERLKVVHVTTHVALREVPSRLSAARLLATIALAHQALVDLGYARPRLAVAGLNPHAGESGLFGREEAECIRPAVEKAREQGWNIAGPLPGDTLFHRAYQGEFDAVVAIYHDQGHIPVKLVAFAEAVNITLGLPIVRTSVDHGTAFDIAGRGRADHGNLLHAIRLGARLAAARRAKKPMLYAEAPE